jgi:hypothetical protein
MADSNALRTLRRKRNEIERAILLYEGQLDRARLDLSHVNAVIAIYEGSGAPASLAPYVDLHRVFKRGEITTICRDALAAEGPLDTRELAVRVLRAKGMNEGDKALRRALAYKIVNALAKQVQRGTIEGLGKRKGVRSWGILAKRAPYNGAL